MASKYDKTVYELLLNFQTRLQGVGNSLGEDLSRLISSTDSAVLQTVINQLPSNKAPIKSQMRTLDKMVKQIETERKKGFDAAEKILFDLGSEVVKKGGKVVKNVAEERGKHFKKELSDKQIEEILRYHPVDGKSIAQWFEKVRTDDLNRITQTVQRASVEGMSVSKVVKAIRGTKENDYKDGVLETTRESARMMARTVINGVASNSMLETCAENADVIDGIKFIATLDAKTCPFCGSYDGKIWKPDEAALVKRPPLHPNCRCTVIPYIDMGEELEGNRPAANADFDKLAEEEYNRRAKENGWERRYSDLSPSTRLKYYYEAQRRYEKETGKPAYSQVKGNTTFQEYFEGQPESFKRSWLGPRRYELYQQGQYDPLKLGNPDTGYRVPIEKIAPVEEKKPETETPQKEIPTVPAVPADSSISPKRKPDKKEKKKRNIIADWWTSIHSKITSIEKRIIKSENDDSEDIDETLLERCKSLLNELESDASADGDEILDINEAIFE